MADVRTEDVTYTAGGATCRGHPRIRRFHGGRRPGVLVVHEWWGLDDYIRGGRTCWRSWATWRSRPTCTGMAGPPATPRTRAR